MRPRTAAGVAALLALLARSTGADPPPPADPPKSPAARKAEETFRAELAHLDEAYRRDLKAVTDRYVKELDQALKAALDKADLDEAQRVLARKKALADDDPGELASQRRKRLAGTTWVWEGKNTLTLNADGTIAASWMKGETGRWYVNPDLTVMWWSTGHNLATVMTFNRSLTEHNSYVPKADVPRAGKRLH